MATNNSAQGAVAAILAALNTMQSNVASKDKAEAHEFLEKFQKSVRMAMCSGMRKTDMDR